MRHDWAAVCLILGGVAQLASVYFAVRSGRAVRATRALPSVLDNGDGTVWLNPAQVDALVKTQAFSVWTLMALVIGVVAGLTGGLLAL